MKDEKAARKPFWKEAWFYVFVFFFVIILTLITVYGNLESFSNFNGEVLAEEDFNELEDVSFQILDTQHFTDKGLESWFLENRKTAGEYIYEEDGDVYILLSVGRVSDENTFIVLNGVKKGKRDQLTIGYDKIKIEN